MNNTIASAVSLAILFVGTASAEAPLATATRSRS